MLGVSGTLLFLPGRRGCYWRSCEQSAYAIHNDGYLEWLGDLGRAASVQPPSLQREGRRHCGLAKLTVPSKPAVSIDVICSCLAFAVTANVGICPRILPWLSISRRRRMAPIPSSTGICTAEQLRSVEPRAGQASQGRCPALTSMSMRTHEIGGPSSIAHRLRLMISIAS